VDLQLTGSVAIVTGASRGLGRAIARGLVGEGVRVVAAARSTDTLAELREEFGEVIEPVTCDVADPDQIAALVPRALDRFGGLDIVVNNAGIAPAGRFLDTPLTQWRQVFDVNVLGPVALIQSAAEHLLAQGSGKVINIGSLSSLRGKPILAAYSASKGALLRLTEALSAEWAARGVQVNMIAPGGFATEAQQAVLNDPAVLARRVRKIPTGRMGEADEIAALACYLASPRSNFVTGSCYTIDGGELAKL
jgi:2-deoxy-D-gluconate 3-dehydrogenase